MNEFIEKNRRLLNFYCTLAKIFGVVLISGGTIWFLISAIVILAVEDAAGTANWPYFSYNFIYASVSFISDFLSLSLIVFLIEQILKYLLVSEHSQGYILRNGDRILYFYAAIFAVYNIVMYYFLQIDHIEKNGAEHLLLAQPLVVPLLVKIMIFVGLAHLIRLILPVIEESKTLV